MAGDIIILEEAAYCDPGLISEVVVPLLSVSSSVLLCISTLLESGNHYSSCSQPNHATHLTKLQRAVVQVACSSSPTARASLYSNVYPSVSCVTTALRQTSRRSAHTNWHRCRAGSRPPRWRWSSLFCLRTPPCSYASPWVWRPTRVAKRFLAPTLTSFWLGLAYGSSATNTSLSRVSIHVIS